MKSNRNKLTQITALIAAFAFAGPVVAQTTSINEPQAVPGQIARRILVIYDSNQSDDVMGTSAVHFAMMPLEFMGFIPILKDANKPLPAQLSKQDYAGIVVWTGTITHGFAKRLNAWLLQQIKQGEKVVFMGNFGFPMRDTYTKPFGITAYKTKEKPKRLTLVKSSPMVGYETKPYLNPFEFQPVRVTAGKVLLEVKTESGLINDAVVIMPWGGYALHPYVIASLPNGQ